MLKSCSIWPVGDGNVVCSARIVTAEEVVVALALMWKAVVVVVAVVLALCLKAAAMVMLGL